MREGEPWPSRDQGSPGVHLQCEKKRECEVEAEDCYGSEDQIKEGREGRNCTPTVRPTCYLVELICDHDCTFRKALASGPSAGGASGRLCKVAKLPASRY